MLMLHFRNAASVLLILMPVVIGICWMLGFMAVFHMPFNPANIISLTLLIGIGVSNGIHIINRFTEEKHPTLLAKSTGKAVLVSALTRFGLCSLMLAKTSKYRQPWPGDVPGHGDVHDCLVDDLAGGVDSSDTIRSETGARMVCVQSGRTGIARVKGRRSAGTGQLDFFLPSSLLVGYRYAL
jgi:hypothetical protein